MKHLWMIIGFLLLCGPAFAQDFIVTSDEYIVVSGNVSDTLGRTRLTPDSIRIVVTDSAGTELSDAWFEAADAQAVLNGDIITFFDQWNDINGAASVGTFSLMVTIASDAQDNVDVYSNYNYTIRGVTVGVEAMHSDVAGLDGWAPITDNDSLIMDQSTLEDMTVATVTTVTGGATATNLDSVLTAITDANKGNFKATGFATSGSLDSVLTAIADANKGNFKATGFSTHSAANVWSAGTRNLTALGFALAAGDFGASSLDGKGDWNIGKTGYSLSQTFPTNFADMAITVTTGIVTSDVASIQTDAIDADAIASDAIGSDELAASAVIEFVDSTWDRVLTGATHNITNSAGKRLRDVSHIIIAEGTAQRGNSLGIVLASATSFADAVINGNIITIIGGTGEGQSRHIHDFTGSTDSITLHDGDEWTTNPDASSIYIINPAAQTSVIHIDDSAKADMEDAVWNALVASHTTALTYGDTLPEMLRLIQDTTDAQGSSTAGLDTLSTVFQLRLATLFADSAWLSLLVDRDGVAGSFGDSAQGWGATTASASDTANFIDALLRLITTDTTTATLFAALVRANDLTEGDSTNTILADANKGNLKADISALPDTTNTNAIEDKVDSVTTAIADANKGNFKATGFSTHAPTAIVSSGAINTTGGAVDVVSTVTNGVSILTNDAKVIAGFSKDSTQIVIAAEHDSTLWWMGLGIGAKSHTDYAAEEDTIWVVTPAGDSFSFIRLFHPGGSAGDAPDSTLGVIAP